MLSPDPAGTVVVATRNRATTLPATLERLLGLAEQWPVIVVDDASVDQTADVVCDRFPEVQVIRLARQRGACARNVGAASASTELVAFADDDSWYETGALGHAAGLLAQHADVALVAARCVVQPGGHDDPVSCEQAGSPLRSAVPGPSILGFLACTAIVRRQVFLDVGGFHPVLGFVGEEELLALDLRARGWRLVHVPTVVAHHHPGQVERPRDDRRALALRNRVLSRWLRRPLPVALATTGRLAAAAARDRAAREALLGVVRRLPAALGDRHPVPSAVEAEISMLETDGNRARAQKEEARWPR